jgi:hypothetical protein
LAPALVGAVRGVVDPATPASASPPPPTASPPAELRALESKMEQLPVNSERYSQIIHVTATRHTGRHRRHIKRVSVTETEVGEVSLLPLQARLFKSSDPGKPVAIAIGSTLYSYSATFARKDGGRPWIELSGVGAGILFPYHGDPTEEVNAGGTGSYAGLINLLTTASGKVDVVGPAQISGQQTTEVTAVVDPLALIKGAPQAEIRKHPLRERLTAFLTESGLPLRVGTFMHLGPVALAETTEILALNVPVSVTAPPASETISEADFLKLVRRESKRRGTGFSLETPG